MKKILILAIAILGIGVGGYFFFGNGTAGRTEAAATGSNGGGPQKVGLSAPSESGSDAAADTLQTNVPKPTPDSATREPGFKSASSPPAIDLSQIDPNDLQKTPEIRKAIDAAFEQSRETARALVLSLPPTGVFLVAYKRLGELEAGEAEAAIGFTEEIEDDAGLARFYEGIIEGVAATDPDFAMELHAANRETFPETGTVASIVLAATRAGNPKLALWSIRKKLDPSEHNQYFAKVYGTWAAMDPEAAIADISRRGQSPARGAGAEAIFRHWARMDRTAVETWLANHPDADFLTRHARRSLNTQPAELKENTIEMPVFR